MIEDSLNGYGTFHFVLKTNNCYLYNSIKTGLIILLLANNSSNRFLFWIISPKSVFLGFDNGLTILLLVQVLACVTLYKSNPMGPLFKRNAPSSSPLHWAENRIFLITLNFIVGPIPCTRVQAKTIYRLWVKTAY